MSTIAWGLAALFWSRYAKVRPPNGLLVSPEITVVVSVPPIVEALNISTFEPTTIPPTGSGSATAGQTVSPGRTGTDQAGDAQTPSTSDTDKQSTVVARPIMGTLLLQE
jgi:hypothetical protein